MRRRDEAQGITDMNGKDGVVLVTGSNGRIGSAVMQRLRKRFDQVVGFDRKAPALPPPDCTRISVDIGSDVSVREGLDLLRAHHGTKITAVVHLAAYYDFLGKPSPQYDAITVDGTARLLRGLREHFVVEQFVFSSTMLVHQPAEPGQVINEDWPLGPTWAYPESKVKTEALIRRERGPIPAVLLRFAGVYDDVCHSPPLANQIQRIYERQLASRLYSGSTSHGQAFIHLDDVVDAIERSIARRGQLPSEAAILIGEPQTLSYDELQHTFQRLIHHQSWESHHVPGFLAKAGAWLQDHLPGQDSFIKPWMIDRANDHYALDITRAKTLLDWTPQHSLRTTLPKMVAALLADPIGWYREHGLEPPSDMTEMTERQVNAVATAATAIEHPTMPISKPDSPLHTCPLHPQVCQALPGNCPRCGLALEPAKAPLLTAKFACPMDPEVTSEKPGRCPKCAMPLELSQTTDASQGERRQEWL